MRQSATSLLDGQGGFRRMQREVHLQFGRRHETRGFRHYIPLEHLPRHSAYETTTSGALLERDDHGREP